ncbi:early nodulin-like protein 1 [Miscanthus floridulus]|uniref:early nodulin-like protein 1 n=1 Tax=Miscanthus floridulus TaxID=154761 RepID=UPI00345827AD
MQALQISNLPMHHNCEQINSVTTSRNTILPAIPCGLMPLRDPTVGTNAELARLPCWNATFRFAVPPTTATVTSASLHVLLRAERFLGDHDVCEVVVPLAEVLAGATGAGAQLPQVVSYQVRKLHRWEPQGVLNVSYCLCPVEALAIERTPEKPTYAPVGVSQQPFGRHPSAVVYQVPPAPSRPAVRVAEHDEAGQQSPVMGVPQKASHPPAKQDAYRPATPPPRPAAVHATGHENAHAPASAPPPRNGGSNWALLPHNTQSYASAAESMSTVSRLQRRSPGGTATPWRCFASVRSCSGKECGSGPPTQSPRMQTCSGWSAASPWSPLISADPTACKARPLRVHTFWSKKHANGRKWCSACTCISAPTAACKLQQQHPNTGSIYTLGSPMDKKFNIYSTPSSTT